MNKKPLILLALITVYLLSLLMIWKAAGNKFVFVADLKENDSYQIVTDEDVIEVASVEPLEDGNLRITLRSIGRDTNVDVDVLNSKGETLDFCVLHITKDGTFVDLVTGGYPTINYAILATVIFLFCLAFVLFYLFLDQIRTCVFSYNAIYYIGFFIYVFMAALWTLLSYLNNGSPETLIPLSFYSSVYGFGRTFSFLSFPVLFLLALGLIVSNISLIRHEGKSFTNTLAALMGVALIIGEILAIFFDLINFGSYEQLRLHDCIRNGIQSVFLYLLCIWIGSCIMGIYVSHITPRYDKDYLIILGCAINKDGTPTPLLRGRCDCAIDFYRKQKEVSGKDATFICSGGQGSNEVISEAESMKNYLLTQGIPEYKILMENKSTNTYENMKFSKAIINDENANVAFFTTKFHLFRSGIWALRAGMKDDIQGNGAPTKWYFWPNAFVREFIGLLSQYKLEQAVMVIGMIVLYAGLTYLLN